MAGLDGDNPVPPEGQYVQEAAEVILILAFPELAPLIILAFEIITILEDLIGFLLDLFTGRPREEATIQVAKRLMKAVNPAARHWGLCMIRALHQWDIVISESGTGSQIEGAMFHNFVANMVNQGISEHRARELGVQQLSRDAQAGSPLPIELQTPLPDGFFITGPGGLDNLYVKLYNRFLDHGLTPTEAMTKAQSEVMHKGPLRWVFKVQFTNVPPRQPQPNVPPIGGPQPGSGDGGGGSGGGGQGGGGDGGGGGGNGGGGDGGGGNSLPSPDPVPLINPITKQPSPQGYGYDRTTQQDLPFNDDGSLQPPPGYGWNPCTNSTYVLPPDFPAQWPPVAPPPTPTPATGTDQIDACCQLIAVNLQYLASVVAAIPLAPGANSLAPQLEQLNANVANIANELRSGSSSQPPLDFTPIIEAIKGLYPRTNEDPTGENHNYWFQGDYTPAELDQLVAIGALDPQVRATMQGIIHVKVSPHFPAKKIAEYTKKFDDLASKTADEIQSGIKSFLGKVVTAFSDKIESDLEAIGNADPDAARTRFASVMADAFEFGTTAHIISLAAETLAPLKHLGIAQLAEFAAEFAGFKELVSAYHRPVLSAAMFQPSTYHAQKTFRPHLFDAGTAASHYSRRLIERADLEKYLGYAGYADGLHGTIEQASFGAISPRLLVRELGVFNVDKQGIVDAMRFSGNRESDITLTIDAQEQAGLARLAQPVINQLVTAASDGLFTEAELTSEFQALNLTSGAIDLLLQRVRIQRFHKLSTEYKNELDIAAKGGVISILDYHSSLAAIGFQQAEIDVYSGIVNVTLQKATLREQAREQAREARDVENTLIKTAIQEFRRGNLIGAALTGALAAGGLTPEQVAAHVALETVKLEPTVRPGSTLSKFAQDQVTNAAQRKAIIEAYSKGLILPHAARDQLKALGMPDAEITAELNYQYSKSQKKGNVTPPTP